MGHSEAPKRSRFPGYPLRGFQPSGSYPRATGNSLEFQGQIPRVSLPKSSSWKRLSFCVSSSQRTRPYQEHPISTLFSHNEYHELQLHYTHLTFNSELIRFSITLTRKHLLGVKISLRAKIGRICPQREVFSLREDVPLKNSFPFPSECPLFPQNEGFEEKKRSFYGQREK